MTRKRPPLDKSSESPQLSNRAQLAIVLLVVAVIVTATAIYLAYQGENPSESDTSVALSPAEQAVAEAHALMNQAPPRPEAAIRVLRTYIEQHPDDHTVRPTLAKIYLALGETENAHEQIDTILTAKPDNANALWMKGMLLAGQNEMEAANEFFAKAAAQPSAGANVWGSYGLKLLDEGNVTGAEEFLQKAVDAGSEDGRFLTALAQIDLMEDKPEEARELLLRATQTFDDLRAWALLAEAQNRLDQPREAIRSLERALELAGGIDRGGILMELGRMHRGQKNWLPAADAYAEASAYPHLQPGAWVRAARYYFLAERYARAMKFIDLAHADRPDDPDVNRLRKAIEDARYGPAEGENSSAGSGFLDRLVEQAEEESRQEERTDDPAEPFDPLNLPE